MGISISGANAISGLSGNDTDFDEVLEPLKKIESTQPTRLQSWKSDWSLRYEAFTQLIDQVKAASSMLSQLGDKNNFVTKNVQSRNDNCITAVANASAQDVQHTINAIWANTGHVFAKKTDLLNTSGEDQYFPYRYAGKDYDFRVPANATLESFANMINNLADNPGIKVSIIQTGNGYVYQVAGKDAGVDNDLQIYNPNLPDVKAISAEDVGGKAMNLTTHTDASGEPNPLGGKLTADLTVSFTDKLDRRLDGQDTGAAEGDLEFLLLREDGTAGTIKLAGNSTYRDLLKELDGIGATAPNGDNTEITLMAAMWMASPRWGCTM